MQKNFVPRSPLGLNYPCLSVSTSAEMNCGDDTSRNVFTKRELVEKLISNIMRENLGEATVPSTVPPWRPVTAVKSPFD